MYRRSKTLYAYRPALSGVDMMCCHWILRSTRVKPGAFAPGTSKSTLGLPFGTLNASVAKWLCAYTVPWAVTVPRRSGIGSVMIGGKVNWLVGVFGNLVPGTSPTPAPPLKLVYLAYR